MRVQDSGLLGVVEMAGIKLVNLNALGERVIDSEIVWSDFGGFI